jgi:hypothetical protein
MTLKKFLKPDWRKIVIFILIIILDGLIYYFLFCSYIGRPAVYFCKFPIISLPNYFKSGCDDTMINGTLVNKYNFISWRCDKPTYSEYMNYTYFENCGGCDSILNILYFPINLIYQYLLSCLIVWIYDKARKRK